MKNITACICRNLSGLPYYEEHAGIGEWFQRGSTPLHRAIRQVKMQYYNNILAIETRWLLDNNIMTISNYQNLTHRHDIQVVRRACAGTPALVAFESLPERFKTKVLQLVPDPYRAAKTNALEECIEASAEIAEFSAPMRLPSHLSFSRPFSVSS